MASNGSGRGIMSSLPIRHAFAERRRRKAPDRLIRAIEYAEEAGAVDVVTARLLRSTLAIANRQVREVMTPAPEVIVINRTASLADVTKIITEQPHSRFPVVGDSLSDVEGVLLARRFFSALVSNEVQDGPNMLEPYTTRPLIVPETRHLADVLPEFQTGQSHLAIVVDEFGAISGCVSIEDVLEEIVGEIKDETDNPVDDKAIEKTGENTYSIVATLSLADLNERMGTSLKSDHAETLAGLLLELTGRIPDIGHEGEIDGAHYRILDADHRRLIRIELRLDDPTHGV